MGKHVYNSPEGFQWPRREGTPLNKRSTHNRQKQTRKRLADEKKRKGLRDLVSPKVVYYLVVKPLIDIVIEIVQSSGLL